MEVDVSLLRDGYRGKGNEFAAFARSVQEGTIDRCHGGLWGDDRQTRWVTGSPPGVRVMWYIVCFGARGVWGVCACMRLRHGPCPRRRP